MSDVSKGLATSGKESSSMPWLRALELTAPIASHRHRIFPVVIEEIAGRQGSRPALLSDRESLTYGELTDRAHVRRLSRVEFAGGDLPHEILDSVPILTHHADPPRRVDGHHGGRARMFDVVDLVVAPVGISQNYGGEFDHEAAVNQLACNRRGFQH